jgi:hypothetical protein
MTKGSGINYFINEVGVSDLVRFFYTFESGQTHVPSISGGIPLYSGLINGDTGVFWSKPGSGLFSGTYLTVTETGLGSEYFTNLFSFELVNTGKQLLISTLENGSGYEIGLNDAQKLYFRGQSNGANVYATSNINLSSKNLISIGYLTNNVELGYYNFNSKSFETESFNQDFGLIRNDNKFVIGSGFTGYIDYFVNFNLLVGADSLSQLASGWAFIPTGYTYETETVCTDRITGYGQVPYVTTGFVGFSGQVLSSNGANDFTGAFPITATGYQVTGIVESGYTLGALSTQECITYTGAQITLYDTLTGYASSFGMDKVLVINYLDTADLVKVEKDYTPFNDLYNKNLTLIETGFYSQETLSSGRDNLYLNGVAITNSGISYSGQIITSDQFSNPDEAIYDSKEGDKRVYLTGFNSLAFTYSGQQIFLNGQNLVSGDGFVVNGGALTITGQSTGISGVVFERPISLSYETGSSYLWTGRKFSRWASLVFLNGIRQELREDYLEGSNYDLLKGNSFNEYNNNMLYSAEGNFWD